MLLPPGHAGEPHGSVDISAAPAAAPPSDDAAMVASPVLEQDVFEEPAAKQQKMTVSKIGNFRYPHVDDVDVSMGMEFDFDIFPES